MTREQGCTLTKAFDPANRRKISGMGRPGQHLGGQSKRPDRSCQCYCAQQKRTVSISITGQNHTYDNMKYWMSCGERETESVQILDRSIDAGLLDYRLWDSRAFILPQ